jgi:uncharacterized membrane protein (UPF0136 family)
MRGDQPDSNCFFIGYFRTNKSAETVLAVGVAAGAIFAVAIALVLFAWYRR